MAHMSRDGAGRKKFAPIEALKADLLFGFHKERHSMMAIKPANGR
jgi:hypothetical protein